MARIGESADLFKCSFCGKSQKQVQQLIAGPGVYICDECVELCNEIIEERMAESSHRRRLRLRSARSRARSSHSSRSTSSARRPPSAPCRSRSTTTTSASARTAPSSRAEQRADEVEIAKSNILLIGPTGCGKTYLAQTLAKRLNVPFAVADATALTEAGYVGEDVENILLKLIQAADFDTKRAETGIIYIDEVDKIARKAENPSITRDVSGEGVQQALLKILEGTVASVPPAGRAQAPAPGVHPDRHDERAVHRGRRVRRARRHHLEPGRQARHRLRRPAAQQGRRPQPVQRGAARRPAQVRADPRVHRPAPGRRLRHRRSTRMALMEILTEPKNALVKQYQRMFELDGVDLEFDAEALEAIADLAVERKTGARGLRAILEDVLGPIMFEIPSTDDVEKVIVTRAAVDDGAAPTFVLRREAQERLTRRAQSRADVGGRP